MSRIVFAGVVAWVDPNLKKLNICSIRAGLRFLSTRTYINNVHSCSVVHTSTEFYFLPPQGTGPSGRCLCLPGLRSSEFLTETSRHDPQLLYGPSPSPSAPLKPHDVQPHPQKTIGNHP